jgi:hypothetical protein
MTPHMGRHSYKVKPLCDATSPRIVLRIDHLNAMNAWESKRTPGR